MTFFLSMYKVRFYVYNVNYKLKIYSNLKMQINAEYEKPLHERKAVDCKRPNIVFLISSLDGIFPFIKSAA